MQWIVNVAYAVVGKPFADWLKKLIKHIVSATIFARSELKCKNEFILHLWS